MWAIGNFIWYVLFTPLQPTADGLLSMTRKVISSTNPLLWFRENPFFIVSLIVVVIMGILAQWQVNRAQDKAKDAKIKLTEEKAKSAQNIAAVYRHSNEMMNQMEEAKEEAEKLLQQEKEKTNELQKSFNKLIGEKNRKGEATTQKDKDGKELENLIKPIYLIYKKDHDELNAAFNGAYKDQTLTPALMSSDLMNMKEAKDIIDLFNKYGDLTTQPELKERIGKFCVFKQEQRKRTIPWNDPYFQETWLIVDEIEDLITKRYNELMWGKEKPKRKDAEDIERELEFVSSLFSKLNKNTRIIDYMATFTTGRINTYKRDDPKTLELEKLEEDIKEIMMRDGYFSESIYKEIQTYHNLIRKHNPENSLKIRQTLLAIRKLLENRQAELIDERRRLKN